MTEKLCEDEGCPQAGTPHECVTLPRQEEVHKTLAEFFRAEFRTDALAVGDWLAQGGQDPDLFLWSLDKMYPEKRIKA